MTATLTATPDVSNFPPRVILSGSGFTGSTVTVARADGTSALVNVRALANAPLVSGAFIGYDYEAPDGVSATWTATTATDSVSAAATVPATGPRLVHPGIPDLSQPLTITGMGDMTTDLNQGVHRPLGRRTPIVITDGQRHAPTFDLTVLTSSQAAEASMSTLLDDGATLLLQIGYDPSLGVSRTYYLWVSVGQVTKSALAPFFRPDLGGDDFSWTLPCTVSSRPSGSLRAQRTWADVVASNATWADVASKYATWRDLILDNQSTTAAVIGGGGTGGETFVNNGDGTITVTGATNNGDGTITVVSGVNNGDGTVTVAT